MEGRARVGPKDEEDKTLKTSGERQRRSGKGRSRKGLQGWEESSEATLSASMETSASASFTLSSAVADTDLDVTGAGTTTADTTS